MGSNPILFLDSAETNMNTLQTLNPFDISNITILKPKKAKKTLGEKGVDGAIYVTTVKTAKNIYWNYPQEKAKVKWINQNTVNISGHVLDVKKDTFDFRYDTE